VTTTQLTPAPATELDLRYYPGDTQPITLRIDPAPGLTGATLTFTLKTTETAPDDESLWWHTTANGRIRIIDAPAGLIRLHPTLADSQRLTPHTTYHAELTLVLPGDTIATRATGYLAAQRRITRTPTGLAPQTTPNLLTGEIPLPPGETIVHVEFTPPWPPGTIPVVTPAIQRPAGGDNLWATLLAIDHAGFTAELSGAPKTEGHRLWAMVACRVPSANCFNMRA
jgi:hypothetical protein